jgi:Trypsin-like peptidase domain
MRWMIGLLISLQVSVATAAEYPWQGLVMIVAEVDTGSKQGSGFFIAPNRIATAYHVVFGSRSIEVFRTNTADAAPAEHTKDVKLVSYRADWDLAILEVNLTASPLTVIDRVPPPAEDLVMLGSASGISRSVYAAKTFNSELIPAKFLRDAEQQPLLQNKLETKVLPLQGIIYGGLSGGPVVDKDYAVVGLVSGSERIGGTQGWAIPGKLVLELIEQSRGTLPKTLSAWRWDPIPFVARNQRTAENLKKPNAQLGFTLLDIQRAQSRLSVLNRQLGTLSSLYFKCKDWTNTIRISLREMRPFPVINQLAAINQLTRQPVPLEATWWHTVRDYADLLEERATLVTKLNGAYDTIKELPNRWSVDVETATQFRHDLAVLSNMNEAARITFEEIQKIRIADEVQSFRSFNWSMYGSFSSMRDVEAYLQHADRCVFLTLKYIRAQQDDSPFSGWSDQRETPFYEALALLMSKYEQVIFFVPVY